jgi:membrane protein implicated in regulation of membrane protease activity
MTEPEFKELADLWREPDQGGKGQQEEFEKLARQARRQVRLMAYGDVAWLVLIAGSVLAAVLLHPTVLNVLAGILTLAVMLWLNWRRRLLRRELRSMDIQDRSALLAGRIRLARANVRRLALSLTAIPPTLLLAILFRVVTKEGGSITHPIGPIVAWATSARGIVALLVLVGMSAWVLRSLMRQKTELRGLEELSEAYAEETRRDELDGA